MGQLPFEFFCPPLSMFTFTLIPIHGYDTKKVLTGDINPLVPDRLEQKLPLSPKRSFLHTTIFFEPIYPTNITWRAYKVVQLYTEYSELNGIE